MSPTATTKYIPVRIPESLLGPVIEHLALINATNGVDVKLASYARGAIIAYPKHKKMEAALRRLYASIAVKPVAPNLDSPVKIAVAIDRILTECQP